MAPRDPKRETGKGMVGHTAAETDGTLPLLWNQWEHEIAQAILWGYAAHGAEMAQSAESAADILLEAIPGLSDAISFAATANHGATVHSCACAVSLAEEPDVGNPQVRFCEGR